MSPSHAYGPTGHRIVGTIAESYLCAEADVAIGSLLDGESLAEAGLWADRIRGNPDWRYTSPWHYINVADDAPIERAGGGDRGDVLWAIRRFSAEVADPSVSPRRRAEALRFLVHFIADVHQPLHVGREEDRGGNEIDVLLGSKRTNLHALWDAQALLKADRRGAGYRVDGQTEAILRLTERDVRRLQRTPPRVWARESQYLRPYVYAFRANSTGGVLRPDADYLALARELSKLRLSQAGVRLAGELNRVFCPGGRVP
ncbi:MAG: S1/P1 nuclease [Gammaproteobacteria bacterium]|nr:S1/P1 nuclease [Gammaproteobacteria bacterium]